MKTAQPSSPHAGRATDGRDVGPDDSHGLEAPTQQMRVGWVALMGKHFQEEVFT